jgi:hypothetical protein
MNPDECKQALLTGVEIIDPLLNPNRYTFEIDGVGVSSGGPFASGFYVNGNKRIGLIYRAGAGLGAVIYEYYPLSISHDTLMKHLGKSNMGKLGYSDFRFASFSKDKGDPFEALAYDTQNFTLPFLNGTDSEFEGILKQISSARKAKADRKQFVRRLIGAILTSFVYGPLIGVVVGYLFGNQFLGFLGGVVVGLLIFARFLRNEKSNS